MFKIPTRVTSKDGYKLLLILFWGKDFICNYIRAVFLRIPIISMLADYIFPGLSIISFMLAFPYIRKRVASTDIMFVLAVAFMYCMNLLLYPATSDYLISQAWGFWTAVFPLYILGLRIDPEEDVPLLYYLSLINIWLYFVYVQLFGEDFTRQQAMHSGAMGRAYKLLPQLLMISIFVFQRTNIWNVVTLALGIVNLFACGTRGAVICLFVFILIYFVGYTSTRKELGMLFFGALVMGITLLLYEEILLWMRTAASNLGMSERIFNSIQADAFFESSSRVSLIRKAVDAIGQKYVFGYGIAGDRIITGTYTHNLFFELLVSFGVVPGTILFVYLLQLIFRAYIRAQNKWGREIILLLFCAEFIKLFMSSSYLLEPLFFLLLGVCTNYLRINKQSSRIRRMLSRF